MKNTLNLVFDDWEDGNLEPNANSSYFFSEIGRSINDTMDYLNYTNYKKCKIEDVAKYPTKKFYYILNDIWLVKPIANDNILPINKNIISLFKKHQNLFFLCVNDFEVETLDVLINIDKLIGLEGLDKNKFYIVDNNIKSGKVKNFFNLDINIYHTKIMCLWLKRVNEEYNVDVSFIPNKKNSSLFLCQNNKPREHRISLLVLLSKYNIIDDVDWSLISAIENNKCEDECDLSIVTSLLKDNILFGNEINNFYCNVTKYNNNVGGVVLNDCGSLKWSESSVKYTYENSYVNIATETLFTERVIHITEKSFKAFSYFHFPLFLASHHHVKYLRENYDFDFFDDIIDHSYDNVVDNSDRLFKFVEEVKRIQENKDFFIKFYEENQDRFLKNHEKHNKLNNQGDIDFFDSLI